MGAENLSSGSHKSPTTALKPSPQPQGAAETATPPTVAQAVWCLSLPSAGGTGTHHHAWESLVELTLAEFVMLPSTLSLAEQRKLEQFAKD